MTKGLLIALIVFGLLNKALAQRPAGRPAPDPGALRSNLHKKFIRVGPGPVQIDSLSLVPNAVEIYGIAPDAYRIDYAHSTLTWLRAPKLDSVLVVYRRFSFPITKVTQRLDYHSVMDRFVVAPSMYNGPGGNGRDDFFNFGNISYSGSFGRAISFGNSQDAVVTSNLNLQISGYLADSIEIAAAITDNNIPIQPDGTTAELNDFDRIFLQFKKRTGL